jgi:hypothetical protein
MSLRPNPNVIARAMQPGGVLVHLGDNVIYELNATGMAIWTFAGEGLAPPEIAGRLTEQFDITREHAEAAIDTLFLDLQERGLLV